MDASHFYFLQSSHPIPGTLQYSQCMTFSAFVIMYLMNPYGKGHGTPHSGLKTYGSSLSIGHPRLVIGSCVLPLFPIMNCTFLIAWPRRNHGELMYRYVYLLVHVTTLTMQAIGCHDPNHMSFEHFQQEISWSSSI